jgi:hypothetical protein
MMAHRRRFEFPKARWIARNCLTTRLATGANVTGTRAQYAVARDGRFLNVRVDDEHPAPITVVLNRTAGFQTNR